MIDFYECMGQGLLKRIPPSSVQAREQLAKANVLLDEAKRALGSESPNSAVIAAYAAMLDSARAVLFQDGYREKSHACVARYLEAKHSGKIGMPLIDLLDQYRDKRHKTMYSGDYYPTMDEARRAVSFAEEFVGKIEGIIK